MKNEGVVDFPAYSPWYNSGKSYEEIQKIKDDYKANINSTGEVPTLVVDGNIIAEADVISEYLEDAFPTQGGSLMPVDAIQRSKVRHWLKVLANNSGVNAHYALLKNQEPSQDESKIKDFYKGLESFCRMASATGPFFLGEKISLADVMLAPFYDRFRHTLKFYRGVEYVPTDLEKFPWGVRAAAWAAAVENSASFQQSSSTPEHYIALYSGYAGGRGASTIGS